MPALVADDLIACIKEDITRAEGHIHLLQKFLNDKKAIRGKVIDMIDKEKTGGKVSEGDVFAPYSPLPWSALGGYCSPHPGSRLVQYGMGGLRGGVVNPTVIYDNFLVDGVPQPPHSGVLKYLRDSGVLLYSPDCSQGLMLTEVLVGCILCISCVCLSVRV